MPFQGCHHLLHLFRGLGNCKISHNAPKQVNTVSTRPHHAYSSGHNLRQSEFIHMCETHSLLPLSLPPVIHVQCLSTHHVVHDQASPTKPMQSGLFTYVHFNPPFASLRHTLNKLLWFLMSTAASNSFNTNYYATPSTKRHGIAPQLMNLDV